MAKNYRDCDRKVEGQNELKLAGNVPKKPKWGRIRRNSERP